MRPRLPDWPERLAAWVAEHRATPFEWGTWDCVRAADSCAMAITGESALDGLEWFGIKGALRQLEAEGGLEAAVTRRLGEPVPAAYAQRGDVCLLGQHITIAGSKTPAIGVCIGAAVVAPSATGMEFFGMQHAVCAWPLGR